MAQGMAICFFCVSPGTLTPYESCILIIGREERNKQNSGALEPGMKCPEAQTHV